MNTTKVTTQGTISLPVSMRRKFNMKPGDTLIVQERNSEIVITKTPDITTVQEINKKYLKNFKIKEYRNGDGLADYITEKYGKK